MWKELLFKGHQVFKSITSSWNRASGIHSLAQTESGAPISRARKPREVRPPAAPPRRHPTGTAGRRKRQMAKAPKIRVFHLFKSANSLNVMKIHRQTHQFLGASRATKPACQNSGFCQCQQQITAHYGFHAVLTLQCLFNVEQIHQIFTCSGKLHDSFNDL